MIMLIKERLKKILSEFPPEVHEKILLPKVVTGSEDEPKQEIIPVSTSETRVAVEESYHTDYFKNIKPNYLDALPDVPPITVAQFRNLLACGVFVLIKPCSHRLYWRGDAIFIPKDFYDCEVRDISLRRIGEDEIHTFGTIAIYIDKIERYEKDADKMELSDINRHYGYGRERKEAQYEDNTD